MGGYSMDSRTRIKMVITAEKTTLKKVMEEINARHPDKTTTPQAITNKLAKKTIRLDEVIEIMDILGYDVVFRSRKDDSEY